MTSAEAGAGELRKRWTLVLASLGVFMAALDTLVVTTALNDLRLTFDASLSELEWTINAYVLTFACALLSLSALADRFGRRKVYAAGLVLFAAASAVAALSPTIGVLIAARAGQGLACAILMPVSLTLISDAFPVEKRGAAIGMWGAFSGLAVAIGPVFGGVVVTGLDWSWIFWVNVPIGLVAAVLTLTRLPETYGPHQPLDLYGLVLASASAFLLAWGLVRVGSHGWADTQVVVSLVAGVMLMAVFLLVEGRRRAPMVRLSLFRNKAFNAASWVNFFMYAPLFGALFLMAQFLQIGLGDSPLMAGFHLLAWTGISMFIAPVVGPLADKYGNRLFMVLGMAFQAIGFGWVAAVAEPGIGFLAVLGPLLVAGIGIGIVFPTVANGVMTSVGPELTGIASGTSATLRELGGVFGVALTASVFAHPGNYTSSSIFINSFSDALWLCAAFSAAGAIVGLAYPSHSAFKSEYQARLLQEQSAAS
ncbi:MFS transporter [Actinoplanes capillaceus]|uniref:MFS transporter n=1 Tax=Actinoplanes campanulatus TaxID=113559 RepID=A0ABQ3WSI0_9ACTN|nr:MFS transporter [Actinoplanes capillaceus]GID49212.1 MFS transporter [Actinoplanes capillaceus]